MSATEKNEKQSFFRFGGFTLHLGRNGLYRGEERIHLTPKPLETLIFLVENCGRTIEKKELLDAVWKDTFVTEDTLVHAVREIRRALGDDKENPRFIQTIPRQGYRFVCEVTLDSPSVEPETVRPFPWVIESKRPFPKSFLIAQLTLVVVALVSALIWWVWKGSETGSPRGMPRQLALKQLTAGEFSSGKPAFSPDGKFLLYVSSSDETREAGDIFIMPAIGGNHLRITDRANPSGDMPVFTADGGGVVFSRYRTGDDGSRLPDLWIVPSFGGTPRLFIAEASGAGFSPDGKWVAYTKNLPSRKALWISPIDHLEEHREVSDYGFTPRWSPDGKWLAYTTSYPEGGLGDLWVASASLAGEVRQVTKGWEQMYGLTWGSDSRSIIFASSRTGPFNLWKVSISGGPVEALIPGVGDYASPSVSSDGKTLVFFHGRPVSNLVVTAGPETVEVQDITKDEKHLWPRLSPSGEHVASVMQRPDSDGYLYVLDLKTVKSTRLSDRKAIHPCWVDEENVAYLSRDTSSKGTEVRVVNIITGVPISLTRFPGAARWVAFHSDRKKLAVVLKSPEGRQKIVLRDLEKQADLTIAEGAEYESLRWLPDGSALSWSGSERSSGPESNGIWVVSVGPGQPEPRQLLKDGYGPVWTADGTSVYFSRIGDYSGLWRLDIPQNVLTKVRDWKYVPYHDIVGERLLFAQDSGRSQIYSIPLE